MDIGDELLQDFIAETTETLESLGDALLAWEQQPDNRAYLDAIFRFVHTVKGSCSFLNLPRIGALSHAAEELLNDIRMQNLTPNTAQISAILLVVDRIAKITRNLAGEGVEGEGDDQRVIERMMGAPRHDASLRDDARVAGDAGTDCEGALAMPGLETSGPEIAECPAPALAMDIDAPIALSPRHSTTADPATGAAATPGVAEDEPIDAPGQRDTRVPVQLLDSVMDDVTDLVLARNDLARYLADDAANSEARLAFERVSNALAELRSGIERLRMQPVDRLFSPLRRVARDLSMTLGKLVDFNIDDGDVEIDRELVNILRNPLIQLVRNAVDHGVEFPETRLTAGKPERATLSLSARQSGNRVTIRLEDDGRGLDLDTILGRAVARNVISVEQARAMSPDAIAQLIFLPGFSTRDVATGISGRGVGMDIVKRTVEELGGSVHLENHPGKGLVTLLSMPMTMTIISGLTVTAQGLPYAVPRSAVEEIVTNAAAFVIQDHIGPSRVVTVRDQVMPLVTLEAVLDLPPAETDAPRALLVIAPPNYCPFALSVEAVLDAEDQVVRPTSPLLMATGIYAGTTLPDSGEPRLLLDPAGMAEKVEIATIWEGGQRALTPAAAVAGDNACGQSFVLFHNAAGDVQALPMLVVDRIEKGNLQQIISRDGQLFAALGSAKERELLPVFAAPFADAPDDFTPGMAADITILRLTDQQSDAALIVRDVIGIEPLDVAAMQCGTGGVIAGTILAPIGPVDLLDPYHLFSSLAASQAVAAGAGRTPTRCYLAARDQGWARAFLGPMLRTAGYALAQDVADADIIIAVDETGQSESKQADRRPVLTLAQVPTAGQLARYDRAGILAALAKVQGAA